MHEPYWDKSKRRWILKRRSYLLLKLVKKYTRTLEKGILQTITDCVIIKERRKHEVDI